jgi:hypothetical protein
MDGIGCSANRHFVGSFVAISPPGTLRELVFDVAYYNQIYGSLTLYATQVVYNSE